MRYSLIEFQRKNCLSFLEKLVSFRFRAASPSELRNRLDDLHTAFLCVRNSLSIQQSQPLTLEKADDCGELCRYRAGEFVFMALASRVIAVEGCNEELEHLFVNKDIGSVTALAEMYSDYRTRCCDLCGKYFLMPFYETPLGRVREHGFVLACHARCEKKHDEYARAE